MEADPVLNYGNAAALALWEMSWVELTRTPSRLTAKAPNREERARLLATVTARGFIDDYSGVRISKTGRRFKISRATVWNLLTADGHPCGQAAMFGEWEFL
jgi:MEKHLA domain